jgi:hypothetical protein
MYRPYVYYLFSPMAMVSLTAGPMIDRLQTIISYDRICVMDNGNVVEFDAPEVLHGKNGIFREMCDHSNITLENIRCVRRAPSFTDQFAV